MNTEMDTNDNRDSVEDFLAPFVAAARNDLDQESLAAAAERFRNDIPEPKTATAGGFGWLRLGAGALALTLAIALGQLVVPSNGGSAFAEVQQWFANFRTVHVQTMVTSNNLPIVNLEVWARADGSVRIEQAGIVHVLDPAERAMYTLLPDKQYFKLPLADAQSQPQVLDWFEDIRKFKGKADRLDEEREIDGVRAVGYRLRADDTDLSLWADPASHRPLLLEGALPGGLSMQSTLQFDIDLPPDLFEIPPDFHRVDDVE